MAHSTGTPGIRLIRARPVVIEPLKEAGIDRDDSRPEKASRPPDVI